MPRLALTELVAFASRALERAGASPAMAAATARALADRAVAEGVDIPQPLADELRGLAGPD